MKINEEIADCLHQRCEKGDKKACGLLEGIRTEWSNEQYDAEEGFPCIIMSKEEISKEIKKDWGEWEEI